MEKQPHGLMTGTEKVIRMDQLQSTVETLVRQAMEGPGAGLSGDHQCQTLVGS